MQEIKKFFKQVILSGFNKPLHRALSHSDEEGGQKYYASVIPPPHQHLCHN